MSLTVESWIRQASAQLQKARIPTAQLDTEVLIADPLSCDRSWLHAHGNEALSKHLSEQDITTLNNKIARRAKHEPIAYIRGYQEFYGQEFIVSPDTLTPRPETEIMIELLNRYVNHPDNRENHQKDNELHIIDVGTGSGCIVIAAALEQSKLEKQHQATHYTGLDISTKALQIARKNAQKHAVANIVHFAQCDLREQSILTHTKPNHRLIVLANLPYVPEDFEINRAASKEPAFAIYGGTDGLDYYRDLFNQLTIQPQQIQAILTESLPSQHKKLHELAASHGLTEVAKQDYIQLFTP